MRRFLHFWHWACWPPPLSADEPKKTNPNRFDVTYRLTIPKHILSGPRSTAKVHSTSSSIGAPALFLATHVAKKMASRRMKRAGHVRSLEIEGGLVPRRRPAGSRRLSARRHERHGLGGAEIHGIIGYNTSLIPHRRQFHKDKMTWTRLDWKPKQPMGLGQKGAPGGLEVFARS